MAIRNSGQNQHRTTRRLRRVWLLLPVLIAVHTAGAQEAVPTQVTGPSVLFGAFVGGEQTFGVSNVNVFRGSADCGVFEIGSQQAPAAALDLTFPHFFGDAWGMGVRLGWTTMSGYLTHAPERPIVTRELDASFNNSRYVEVEYEHRLNGAWDMARLDLLGEFRPSDRLAFRLGPWIGRRFNASLSQSEALLDEPTYRFPGGSIERPMSGGERLSPTEFAVGVVAGIGYTILTGGRLSFTPELVMRAELTSAVARFSWRSYTVGLGLGVHFGSSSRQAAPPPDTPVTAQASGGQPALGAITTSQADDPSRRTRTRASLDLFGVDEGGRRLPAATVRVYEVLRRQSAALLESIFFDKGSDDLPERYVRIARDRTRVFSLDSLFGLDPLEVHYQSLNVIGYRMRMLPHVTVTLAGSASAGESRSLPPARARVVRDYLVNVWGVEAGRITISDKPASSIREQGEDHRAENRRVEILPSSHELLDPVVIDKLTRDFEPPLISLDPQFSSDAGIKTWAVELSHNGMMVGRFGSSDTTGDGKLNLNWQVDEERVDLGNSFLAADLTVEDSAGSTVSARAQLPLVIERHLRIVDRSERSSGNETITYSLLAFGHNSTDVNMRNRTVLSEVASSASSGSKITVIGYTDRTGSEGGNQILSRRRAESVAKSLRAMLRDRGRRNVTIEIAGEGYETGRFDNQLPEGRALSREVDVVLERKERR